MKHGRERKAAAPYRCTRAGRVCELLENDTGRVHVDGLVREPVEELEAWVADRLRQDGTSCLGGGPSSAQVLQVLLDSAQAFIPGTVEAPVDQQLDSPSQRREQERDGEG